MIDVSDPGGGAARRLPTTPERMSKLLEQRNFTNGADKSIVLKLYTKMARAVLGGTERLWYQCLAFQTDDEWASPTRLAEALNYCGALKRINLSGTGLTDEGVRALMAGLRDGALPVLERLSLDWNRIGPEGVDLLAAAFARRVCPKLRELQLGMNLFGDPGCVALARAFRARRLPRTLNFVALGANDIGNAGAFELVSALLDTNKICRFTFLNNRIGLAGQSALLRAFERDGGAKIAGALALGGNSPYFPPFLCRAFARGCRGAAEDGKAFVG